MYYQRAAVKTVLNIFGLSFVGIVLTACTAVPEEVATIAPTRVMAIVTYTAVPPTPTTTNTPESAAPPTPAPMCTLPACTENEVYFCPGDCPNSCGTVCATVTPFSRSELTAMPSDPESLADWLQTAWLQNVNPMDVRDLLQTAGWLQNDTDWKLADLDNDKLFEWIALLHYLGDVPVKNIWVINQNGRVFQFYDQADNEPPWAIHLVDVIDITGDGVAELIVDEESCGAHTCYSGYEVYGTQDGVFINLINVLTEQVDINRITVSYADIHFEDYDHNGISDILVHGGLIGSGGAGIERTYTEVWSWDGTAVTLTDTILDPTQYRHHILYEANDEFAAGNLDSALVLYEQAINDASLITPPPLVLGNEADVGDVINQFAAFRLILIDLQQGRVEQANSRLASLANSYPETPITQAAQTVVAGWADGNLLVLCAEVTAVLQTAEYPTGPLTYLGYGNPGLTAADVCPTS